METKIFKMIDGSYVVGKLNKDEDIVEGAELVLVPGQTQGQMGLAIYPLGFPFNKEIKNDIVITKSKYFFHIPVESEIEARYVESVTGIITPNNSIFSK